MPILESVEWGRGRKEAFIPYFHQSLHNTLGDRAPLERKWQRLIVQWRANKPQDEVEFPWPGAANEELPLTDMHVTPIYSDQLQTFHAPEDYWSVESLRPERVPNVNPLREGLTALEKRFLKMRQVNSRAFLDLDVLGTSIYKCHWLHESKAVRAYGPDGRGERRVLRKSQPKIDHVPLQDFVIPANAWSIDPDAPVGAATWVAQRFRLTPEQLRTRAQSESPAFPPYDRAAVEKVIAWKIESESPVDQEIRKEDSYVPWEDRKIELYEVWVRFPTRSEDDAEDDIVVIWHHPTMTILRATYNPFAHGRRPFYRTIYLPSFGFYGIGVAELDEWAQDSTTRLFNGLLNNVMAANTRMYSAPHGSNVLPGEPVYPGKVWFVGPNEQIGEVRLGEVYPSLPQTIDFILRMSQMRTAVNEIQQGDVHNLPSRTPATTVMSALRQSNIRFDMIMQGIREAHSDMGLRTLQNVAQQLRDDPLRWQSFFSSVLGDEDAASVLEILALPIHEIEELLGVSVTATSAMVNKEAEKQQFIGLMQLTQQFYQSLMQTAMMMMQIPPGTPAFDTASASYTGGVELLKRLLERFDIQNPREYLGNMEAIAGALAAQGAGMNAATAPMQQMGAGMMQPQMPMLPPGGMGGF